jgi:phytoene/squalene synthetase
MILGKGLLAQGNITGMNRALGKVGFGNRSLSSSTADATQHCVLLVREKDYSSYLCGLLLEKSLKPHYFAVMAFNIETAIIKDSLRGGVHANTSPAKLRISWWREAIEEVYDGMLSDQKRAQPVVAAVARTIEDKRLTRRFFELMIDAREADLALQQKVSVEDVEEYSEKTHASLLKLCLEVVDVRDDGSDHVASHLARGIGIANAIRSAEVRRGARSEATSRVGG